MRIKCKSMKCKGIIKTLKICFIRIDALHLKRKGSDKINLRWQRRENLTRGKRIK